MKKIILSSLIAVLMLCSCQNETKSDQETKDTTAVVPPPPPVSSSPNDTVPPPPPQPPIDSTDQKVYNFVSMKTPPTYPGGIAKFYDFLGKNIKYPPQAIEKNVQGNVQVDFIVEKDGSVTDIKVVDKKLGHGIEEEAVRVLKLSKKWNPGMNDGKPVRAKYRIPVKFSLGN